MYETNNYDVQNQIFRSLVVTAEIYCKQENLGIDTPEIEKDFTNYLVKISAPSDLSGLYWVNKSVLSLCDFQLHKKEVLKEIGLKEYLYKSFYYETDFDNKSTKNEYQKENLGKGWCARIPLYVLLFKWEYYTKTTSTKILLILFIKQFFKTIESLRSEQYKTKTRYRESEACDAIRLLLSAPANDFSPSDLLKFDLETGYIDIAKRLSKLVEKGRYEGSSKQYVQSLIRFFNDDWSEAQPRSAPKPREPRAGGRYKKVVRQPVAGAQSDIHTLIPNKLTIISEEGIDEDDNGIVQQFVQTNSLFEDQREPSDLSSIDAIFDKKRKQFGAVNVTKSVRKAHNSTLSNTGILSASELAGLLIFCKNLEYRAETKPMAIAIWCSLLLSKSVVDIEPLKIFFLQSEGEEGLYVDKENNGGWQFSVEYSAKKSFKTIGNVKTTSSLAITPCPRYLVALILSVHPLRVKSSLISIKDLSNELTKKFKKFSERKIKGSLSLTKIQNFVVQFINATDVIDGVVFDFSYRNRIYNTRVSRSYVNISDSNRYLLLHKFWKRVTDYAQLGDAGTSHFFFDNDYSLFQSINNLGSNFVPTDKFCITLVKSLLTSLESSSPNRNSDYLSIINYHNAYAHYTCWLLNFATGYRAVHNPLPSLALHLPEWNLLTISDKDDVDFTHSRVVAVPNVLKQQLIEYKKHLFRLAELLRLLEPTLTKKLDALVNVEQTLLSLNFEEAINWFKEIKNSRDNLGPLFIFVRSRSSKFRYNNLSPSSLQKKLDDSLKCQTNAGRHWLKSKLIEKHVHSELVNWQMGHWQSGQAPLSYFSGFSPIKAAQELNIIIEEELLNQGWRICISKLI